MSSVPFNMFGPDHLTILEIVNNLGNVYYEEGKLTEAETMYQQALQGKKRRLGSDHKSSLDTAINLGHDYYKQEKLAEAEAVYLEALAGLEKTLGREHPLTQSVARKLGMALLRQQNWVGSVSPGYTGQEIFGREVVHIPLYYSKVNPYFMYINRWSCPSLYDQQLSFLCSLFLNHTGRLCTNKCCGIALILPNIPFFFLFFFSYRILWWKIRSE